MDLQIFPKLCGQGRIIDALLVDVLHVARANQVFCLGLALAELNVAYGVLTNLLMHKQVEESIVEYAVPNIAEVRQLIDV